MESAGEYVRIRSCPNSLVEEKIYRKPYFFPMKSLSLKPNNWIWYSVRDRMCTRPARTNTQPRINVRILYVYVTVISSAS